MTTPATAQRQDSSLARDLIYALRYYLWRPRVLLTLATIAIVAGLALNWSWLVAAGLAPILIGTLPCLVMCAAGVCMMCRSGEKQSAPVRDAAEAANRPPTLAVAATESPSTAADSSVPPPHSIEAAAPPRSLATSPPAGVDFQPNRERRDLHA